MGHPWPLFSLFKQTLQFLQQIYVKKCPSGIRTHDLQDMSLLSRPGLPAQTLLFTYFLICHNVIYEKTSFVIFAPFTRCFLQKKSFGDLNPIVNVGHNITRTISYFIFPTIASHHCCSEAKNMSTNKGIKSTFHSQLSTKGPLGGNER